MLIVRLSFDFVVVFSFSLSTLVLDLVSSPLSSLLYLQACIVSSRLNAACMCLLFNLCVVCVEFFRVSFHVHFSRHWTQSLFCMLDATYTHGTVHELISYEIISRNHFYFLHLHSISCSWLSPLLTTFSNRDEPLLDMINENIACSTVTLEFNRSNQRIYCFFFRILSSVIVLVCVCFFFVCQIYVLHEI